MNYTYLYKDSYSNLDDISKLEEYDLFISAFINCERVTAPAKHIKSKKKLWIISDINLNNAFLNGDDVIPVKSSDDPYVLIQELKKIDLVGKRICLDSTGFFIPHLLLILRYFNDNNIVKFDVIYTEPLKYINCEDTQFSDDFYNVKQIVGMSGSHTSSMDKDMVIIAAGYDHSRIIDIAAEKKEAKKILLFGFPSTSPAMFQENVFRAHKAEQALSPECFNDMSMNLYAPAYDPFETAQTLKEYLDVNKYTNLYLAPLSTKPQALGMALFFLWEGGTKKSISLIYPMCKNYHNDNSEGITRIWKYTFLLPGKN